MNELNELLDELSDKRFNKFFDEKSLVAQEELTGDQLELYNYLNSVMMKVIDADDFLKLHRDKVKLYLSTGQAGSIFQKSKQESAIALGLRIYTDKEIEEQHLAGFFAHELGHFLIKNYKNDNVPKEYWDRNGKNNYIDQLLNKMVDNDKANEIMSDLLGMKFLEQAGYNPVAMPETLEKLRNWHLSSLEEFADIVVDEHPAMQDRILFMHGCLTKISQSTGKNLNIPEHNIAIPLINNRDIFNISRDLQHKDRQTYNTVVKPEPKFTVKNNAELETEVETEADKALRWKNLLAEKKSEMENLSLALKENFTLANFHNFLEKSALYLSEEPTRQILKECDFSSLNHEKPNYQEDIALKEIDIILTTDRQAIIEKYGADKKGLYAFADSYDNGFMRFMKPYIFDEKLYENLSYGGLKFFCYMTANSFDTETRKYLQAHLVKKNLEESNLNLDLLNQNMRIENPELRNILFNKIADTFVKEYGLDNESPEYENHFNELFKKLAFGKYHPQGMKLADKIKFSEILTDKICAQKKLAYKFRDIVYSGQSLSGDIKEQIFDSITSQTILGIMDNYNIARDSLLDLLDGEFSVQKAEFLKSVMVEKVSSLLQGFDMIEFGSSYDANQYSYLRDKLKEVKKLQIGDYQQIYDEFWASPFEVRTAAVTKMLVNKYTDKDFSKLFDNNINRIIPKDIANREMIVDVMKMYIDCYPYYERPFLLSAMMSSERKSDNNGEFNIGEPLKEFLENMGPAGIKLGQALGSSPDVPEDIRIVMQTMKNQADVPSRAELFDMIDACVPADKQGKIGSIAGCGSYYITVNNGNDVIGLLRPYACQRAEQGFEVMKSLCQKLGEHEKTEYTSFAKVLGSIVDKAQEMAAIETDMELGSEQDVIAHQIYDNRKMKVNGEEYTCKVADWRSHGDEYKKVEKVHGQHFNDLKPGPFKTSFAKAYLELELENIFSGDKFDHDRHGAQLKIDQENKIVGIFDNGAMSIWPPTKEEKQQLGKIIDCVINKSIKGSDAGDALIEAIQTEMQHGAPSEYILSVQRGLLALNDFMREIDNKDKIIILSRVLSSSKSDKDIIREISLPNRILIKGIRNVVKFKESGFMQKKKAAENINLREKISEIKGTTDFQKEITTVENIMTSCRQKYLNSKTPARTKSAAIVKSH